MGLAGYIALRTRQAEEEETGWRLAMSFPRLQCQGKYRRRGRKEGFDLSQEREEKRVRAHVGDMMCGRQQASLITESKQVANPGCPPSMRWLEMMERWWKWVVGFVSTYKQESCRRASHSLIHQGRQGRPHEFSGFHHIICLLFNQNLVVVWCRPAVHTRGESTCKSSRALVTETLCDDGQLKLNHCGSGE